jgi:PAS domain S-box-containing protein
MSIAVCLTSFGAVEIRQHEDMTNSGDDRIAHFVMDGEGNVVEWDDASVNIFGWTRDEALGAKLSELIIPPEQRGLHEAGLAHYKSTGRGKFIGKPLQIVTLHRGGSEVPIAITISMERDGEGYRFPTVARVIERR